MRAVVAEEFRHQLEDIATLKLGAGSTGPTPAGLRMRGLDGLKKEIMQAVSLLGLATLVGSVKAMPTHRPAFSTNNNKYEPPSAMQDTYFISRPAFACGAFLFFSP